MKSIPRSGMTKALLLLLVVSTIAMVPQKASAADQLLMHVPGIPGSSVARAGWIDLFSFSGTAVAPASNGSARVLQSSTQPCQITVLKQLDIAGPRLWAATVTGQTFSTVELQVLQATGVLTPQLFYDIMLTDAQITAVSDSSGSEFPTESVTFKAATVTLAFTPQNADGSPGTPVTTTFACDRY
ncbi:MAG: type VI secretion system tube protein Hcp [Terracidiphilus sp.]